MRITYPQCRDIGFAGFSRINEVTSQDYAAVSVFGVASS
jgi:hypothetical protein